MALLEHITQANTNYLRLKYNLYVKYFTCIYGQVIFKKGAETMGKKLYNKLCWENWVSTAKKRSWTLTLHYIQKLIKNASKSCQLCQRKKNDSKTETFLVGFFLVEFFRFSIT